MDEPTPDVAPVTLQERMMWPARVRITVARTAALSAAPTNVWFEEFTTRRGDTVDIRDEVESLADQLGVFHRISARSGRTSWGGDSGEILAVVLFISGQVTQAVLDHKVSELFAKLRQRREERMTDDIPSLGRSEAIARAKWVVSQRYADALAEAPLDSLIDFDGLEVIGESEDRDAGSWTITLGSKAGWTFDVMLRAREGLVTIDRFDARRER